MECKINGSLLGGHLLQCQLWQVQVSDVGTQNVHRHWWEVGQGHLRYIPTLRMKTPQPIALPFCGAQHPRALWEHAEGNDAASGLQILKLYQ